MLIISRSVNQSILIGNDIRIMVVEILNTRVRLGIDAPREIPIRRGETPPAPPPAEPRDGESLDRMR